MKKELREQARVLRTEGRSIKAIAKELSVAASSVSLWVRDISLTEEQARKLSEARQAICLPIAAAANKKKYEDIRNTNFAQGRSLASKCSEFRVICALYWGEGGKTNREFRLANSDPKMISLVARWLEKQNFTYKMHVYSYLENGLSETEIKDWWFKQIGRRPDKWYLQRISRASQRKNIGKLPYGTCHIRSNGELFFLVMGGIEFLASSVQEKEYGLVV